MNFYERIVNMALECDDCGIQSLVLGWHASSVILEDGRWGLGAVPNPLKEAHVVRERHTRAITGASVHDLARLIVSPFPQEFAAATAVISALFPPPNNGLPLDALRLIPKNDSVAVFGYHNAVIPFLRDWGWQLIIFDDYRNAPDVFPENEIPEKLKSAKWAWLTAEALRDRALPSMREYFLRMNGVFLQAPGVPWLDSGYSDMGVSYLVLPHLAQEASPKDVVARIGVGGDPWNDDELIWKVHTTN